MRTEESTIAGPLRRLVLELEPAGSISSPDELAKLVHGEEAIKAARVTAFETVGEAREELTALVHTELPERIVTAAIAGKALNTSDAKLTELAHTAEVADRRAGILTSALETIERRIAGFAWSPELGIALDAALQDGLNLSTAAIADVPLEIHDDRDLVNVHATAEALAMARSGLIVLHEQGRRIATIRDLAWILATRTYGLEQDTSGLRGFQSDRLGGLAFVYRTGHKVIRSLDAPELAGLGELDRLRFEIANREALSPWIPPTEAEWREAWREAVNAERVARGLEPVA